MPRPLTAAELAGADLVWLLDLTWGGQVYRLASRSLTVAANDGTALRYAGGLDSIAVDLAFDLLDETPAEVSIPLTILFPAGVDVAARVEAGHDLARARGDLALHIVGNTHENRRTILTGSLSEPEYGGPGEPVSATLADLPYEDSAIFPATTAAISTDTFSTLPDSADESQPYPFVFGNPGQYIKNDGSAASWRGSPAYVINTNVGETVHDFLIAGHHVEAGTVDIVNRTQKTEATGASVTNTIDDDGQQIARVNSQTFAANTAEDSYWVRWPSGKAARHDRSANALERGGDLLAYFLRRSSLSIDGGRLEAAATQLNGYRFAGYINDTVQPFEWLQDNLLPLLPVSIVSGMGGAYPIVWRFDAKAKDAKAHLSAGAGFVRDGRVTYQNREIVNDLSLSFAYDPDQQRYRRKLTHSGDDYDTAKPGRLTSGHAKISRRRFGVGAGTLTSSIVYDQNTAAAILDWKIRAKAFPSRAVTYTASTDLAWLDRGDVVTLTDPDLSFASQVCLVQSVAIRLAAVSVTLLVTEDPHREL